MRGNDISNVHSCIYYTLFERYTNNKYKKSYLFLESQIVRKRDLRLLHGFIDHGSL